ncbi:MULTISPECIES: substrate-binding periplasmic protein [Thalassospira]|nr:MULTISPECIES: transporter substrate-binding domain-containing protein [Thalassospira]MCH2273115.1 transporter substrate-binding domain-containing protein [Thalassospira sp.]
MTPALVWRLFHSLAAILVLHAALITGSSPVVADNTILQAQAPRQNVTMMCNPFPPSKIADRPVMPGYDVEILRAAFAVSHIAVNTPFYPWKRAYLLAERGDADGLCSCSYVPERETAFLYSNELGREHIGLFAINEAALDGVKDLTDAKQLTIGVISGYALESRARGLGLDIISANSERALLGLLLSRRLDAIYNFKAPMDDVIRTYNQEYAQNVNLAYHDLINSPYYSCISRKTDNAGFLVERLNHGISVLRKNGVYDDILEKYGISAPGKDDIEPERSK